MKRVGPANLQNCRARAQRRAQLGWTASKARPRPAPCRALQCMSKAEDPKDCKDFRDDYLECLHHRKEVRAG